MRNYTKIPVGAPVNSFESVCIVLFNGWYTKIRYEFYSANFQQLVGYQPGVV